MILRFNNSDKVDLDLLKQEIESHLNKEVSISVLEEPHTVTLKDSNGVEEVVFKGWEIEIPEVEESLDDIKRSHKPQKDELDKRYEAKMSELPPTRAEFEALVSRVKALEAKK